MGKTWRELKSYVECMTDDVLDLPVYIDVKTYGNLHTIKFVSFAGNRHPALKKNTPCILAEPLIDMTKYPTKYPK